jgi:hypothetical protein
MTAQLGAIAQQIWMNPGADVDAPDTDSSEANGRL